MPFLMKKCNESGKNIGGRDMKSTSQKSEKILMNGFVLPAIIHILSKTKHKEDETKPNGG